MGTATDTGRAADEFVITRVYDVPRERLFEIWTESAHLMRWWGPKGFKMLSAEMDLRPGGVFLYGMQMPDGGEMWGKWVFREIVAPERLVFIVAFSDPAGGVTRHPMVPDWPLQTFSTVTFTPADGGTRVEIRWRPHEATERERRTFEEGHGSMQQGWTGTLDKLADYLAQA